MQTSSPQLLVLALAMIVTSAGSASAQSNIRDFGPPRPRRGLSAAPSYYVAPNYIASRPVAYPVPYTQVGYQSIAMQRPAGCAYHAASSASQPYANNPYAYGAYTAGFAPYANGNTSYWSSTTPSQYSGTTLFGTQTVYGKEQPFRNVLRFLVP
jgi:hypothetical protein